jgi:mono/diheme cytochrome c family protein
MPELPNFTDAKWQNSRSVAELKQSILQGKGKFMLPMKDRLAPEDADHLVAYVRLFGGGKQQVKPEPSLVVQPEPTGPAVVPPPVRPPAEQRAGATDAETTARLRAATGMYRQYCLICHGADGHGQEIRASMPAIPDFSNRVWQEGASNAQCGVSILDGKGTLMPAFRGRLTDADVQDLTAYVRAFGPVRAPAAPAGASDFEKRFRQLEEEWDELQKQMRDLQRPAPKP